MRKAHEMTTREAADYLGRHIDTIKRWAKEAVTGHGTQLTTVRVDAAGKVPRYFVDRSEIERLKTREPLEWF